MGQAVLTHHRLPRDGKDYDSHGFFAVRKPDQRIQLPETQAGFMERFCTACGLARRSEPGLSIVIPFVDDNMRAQKIIEFILRNYFFPVLTGRLTADVCGTRIDAQSFSAVAASAGGEQFSAGELASFISEMNQARRGGQVAELPATWTSGLASTMPVERIELLRDAYARQGQLVSARAPLLLKRKDGTEVPSHVDLFLKRSGQTPGAVLFVRDSIILPAEALRYFRSRNCFAALVADDEGVAAFLGDAENPAHTSWSATAEKVTAGWRNAQARLSEIRGCLQQLHDLLGSAIDDVDLNALIDSFSVRGDRGSRRMRPRGPIVRPPVVPAIEQKPKAYRVLRRRGGFAVKGGPGLRAEDLPLRLRIRVAYDVLRGNPFARQSPLDFDFTGGALTIRKQGAAVAPEGPGALAVDALSTDFEVEVEGFDLRRDLAVDSSRRT